MEQTSDNTCQAVTLLERYFFPLKSNALSTNEIQVFPFFLKITKMVSLILRTYRVIGYSSILWHVQQHLPVA